MSITVNIYDENLSPTTVFEVGDNVIIEIVNTYADNYVDTVNVRHNNGSTTIHSLTTSGSSHQIHTSYDCIRRDDILTEVKTSANEYQYSMNTINSIDITPNIYYVDLSVEYDDKWLNLNYGLYDDFEDGVINTKFNAEFQTYGVSAMQSELVATGTTDVIVMDDINYGDFSTEFSFVRDGVVGVPNYYLVFDDIDTIRVEWDYSCDSLNIYDIMDNRYTIIYGDFFHDMSCSGSLGSISVKLEFDSGVFYVYYDIGGGWVLANDNIPVPDFTEMQIKTQCTTDTGLGYVGIQADNVGVLFTGTGNGTEENPFTYIQMYDRINANGTGEYGDIYKCKNLRKITQSEFILDSLKEYVIDVWDAVSNGPWVLIFDNMRSDISFVRSTLMNGIVYNIDGMYDSDLLITTCYDMIITWNGSSNKIGLIKTRNRYVCGDMRTDIVGCTIKSEGGYYTSTGGRN